MKEEGFNPNAVITDQVIDALANIQDHEPGSFREHTEKLTDILLDDFELMEPDNLKRNLDLVQFFRFYAVLCRTDREIASTKQVVLSFIPYCICPIFA